MHQLFGGGKMEYNKKKSAMIRKRVMGRSVVLVHEEPRL
jgi:hypothetical protein